jgi:hypothetical protein
LEQKSEITLHPISSMKDKIMTQSSMFSVTSTVTTETIASLESKVDKLTRQVETSNSQYSTILNKLDSIMMSSPTPNKDNTAKGASTAGRTNNSSGGVL